MMKNTCVIILSLEDTINLRFFNSSGWAKDSLYLLNDTLFLLRPINDDFCLHSFYHHEEHPDMPDSHAISSTG
jgi:hypothetical protein